MDNNSLMTNEMIEQIKQVMGKHVLMLQRL